MRYLFLLLFLTSCATTSDIEILIDRHRVSVERDKKFTRKLAEFEIAELKDNLRDHLCDYHDHGSYYCIKRQMEFYWQESNRE